MFSQQSNRFEELYGLLPTPVVEILRDVLTSSTTPLRHDGPLTLASGRNGPYGENELAENSDFVFKGRPLGTVKYGVATEASRVVTNEKTGRENTWVRVRERDDYLGQYAKGYEEQGQCESWFCSTDTGKKIDLLLAPSADSDASVEAGDIIPYSYDVDGTAVALGTGGRAKFRRSRCVGDWSWVPGYEGYLGQVQAKVVADILAWDTQGVTATYYLPASSGGDPNLHTGDFFSWMSDESGNRVAIDGHLDAKIGTIDMLKPGVQIRRGWARYLALAGRVPIGSGMSSEFIPGSTGGRHPITPLPHKLSIQDHAAIVTTWASVLGEIGTTQLNAQTSYCKWPEYTELSEDLLTSAVGLIVHDHLSHDHDKGVPGAAFDVIDAVNARAARGDATPNVITSTEDLHEHTMVVGAMEPVGGGDTGIEDRILSHLVEDNPHLHTLDGHRHGMPADTEGHGHGINPRDHTHPFSADSHYHEVPDLGHVGWANHATEDFRPPWMAMLYIVRVGPHED